MSVTTFILMTRLTLYKLGDVEMRGSRAHLGNFLQEQARERRIIFLLKHFDHDLQFRCQILRTTVVTNQLSTR